MDHNACSCARSGHHWRHSAWPIRWRTRLLELYDSNGDQIDFNDNWQDNPAEAEIEATMIAPTDPKESAVLQTLAPGGYTAIVQGAGDATGTGLVEVYVLPPAS